jgi:NAD+ kinase
MRILVLGNAGRAGVREQADLLLPFLAQHCEIALVDLEQKEDVTCIDVDLTIVLGGDGAILRAARQMGYCQHPVLGVNLGRLGFLADLSPEELRNVFPKVVAGSYRLTTHVMFECIIDRGGVRQTLLGLNEVVLRSGPPFHMVEVDLIIDGEPVSRYSGDGIILSTPIGSTAYSLSAGGPILDQELPAFVITPICPHTLTNRPVVDSSTKAYTIAIRRMQPTDSVVVVVDGQEQGNLAAEHRLTVQRAPVSFQLVKVPGHSYYRTLRDKLRWGTPPSYRDEPLAGPERKTQQ